MRAAGRKGGRAVGDFIGDMDMRRARSFIVGLGETLMKNVPISIALAAVFTLANNRDAARVAT